MSKDNVEKYDGEKNMDQDAVVAVLPPDDWVCRPAFVLDLIIGSLPHPGPR